jgi:hypothetical protein
MYTGGEAELPFRKGSISANREGRQQIKANNELVWKGLKEGETCNLMSHGDILWIPCFCVASGTASATLNSVFCVRVT